jgi:hypothetical protein
MNGVGVKTVVFVLYLAFAGAVMFVASHYLGTGGRIVAFLVVVIPAIGWLWPEVFVVPLLLGGLIYGLYKLTVSLLPKHPKPTGDPETEAAHQDEPGSR